MLWDRARHAAREGMGALRTFSGKLSPDDQTKLKPIKEELLAAGNEADRTLAGSVSGEGGFITEDQALDLESSLFERGIEDKAFLEKAKASKIRKISTADYKQAIRMIEQWK